MFTQQHRFNWWYYIKAEYDDGSTVILPLSIQSSRSLSERLLFDIKEAKLYQNLRISTKARRAYGYYLCRKFAASEGPRLKAVRFEANFQEILPPDRARKSGSHLDPRITTELQDRIECMP
ncbi:MAG: hypothetical protein AB1898_24830 [Acidobacteriota bacterium]